MIKVTANYGAIHWGATYILDSIATNVTRQEEFLRGWCAASLSTLPFTNRLA